MDDVGRNRGRTQALLQRSWAAIERITARLVDARLGHAALHDDPERAARWLRRGIRDVVSTAGRLDARRARHPLPSVAILARSHFTDDAREVARRLGVDRVILVRREALKAMAAPLLPPGVGDLTYRTSLASAPERMARYRRFLSDVWRHLDPDGEITLVLTANTCYWAEVELGAALEEHGVPLVALHKENLKSPGHEAVWEPIYRQRRAAFLGDRVLVQNEGERALQIRGQVTEADRIEVVGFARLDGSHAHRRATAGQRIEGDLLFASFLPGTIVPRPHGFTGVEPTLGLPVPGDEPRPEDFVDACIALHRVAIRVARELPRRRIIVKTKGTKADRSWVPRILAHTAGAAGIPPNVVVVHAGDAMRLTSQAAVVVGLNTTMLLEAIAAGRPTVSLALGEAADTAAAFVIDLSGAADVVTTEPEAIERIVRHATRPATVALELAPDALAVLQRWTGNSDGAATDRAVAALRRIVAQRQTTATQLSTTRPSTRAANRPE